MVKWLPAYLNISIFILVRMEIQIVRFMSRLSASIVIGFEKRKAIFQKNTTEKKTVRKANIVFCTNSQEMFT